VFDRTAAITDVAAKNLTIRKPQIRDFGASLCSDAVSVFYAYWIRSLAFYSMGSHFAPSGDQKFFRYPRQTTIINHRVPSFTSAGVLQALAIPKFSNKCQLCRENEPSNLRPLFHLISKAISVPKWHRPIYKLWIAALAYK